MTVSAVRGRSKGRSRCCSHQRGQSIPAPGSSATPARAVEPAILTPPVPAPSLSGAEGLPAVTVPDRQLPGVPAATPAIGTSSSESADDNRPNRVGLWCPTSCASPLRVPHLRDSSAKRLLRRFNSHCYFSFLQLAAPYAEMPHTFLGVTVWSTVWTI